MSSNAWQKRIVSLCCSASRCERNWSEFLAVSATVLFLQAILVCEYGLSFV